jgi:hypothetical protein
VVQIITGSVINLIGGANQQITCVRLICLPGARSSALLQQIALSVPIHLHRFLADFEVSKLRFALRTPQPKYHLYLIDQSMKT